MTEKTGWGVRCADPVTAGKFICAYVGEVITDAIANERKGGDQYLYDLDHFIDLYAIQKHQTEEHATYPAHQVPPEPRCMAELLTRRIKEFPAEVAETKCKVAAAAAAATVLAASLDADSMVGVAASSGVAAAAAADSPGGAPAEGETSREGVAAVARVTIVTGEEGVKVAEPGSSAASAATNGGAATASPPTDSGAALARVDFGLARSTLDQQPLKGRGSPPAEGDGPSGGESRSSGADAGGEGDAPHGASNSGATAPANVPAPIVTTDDDGVASASGAADAPTPAADTTTAADLAAAAAAAIDAAALNEALTLPPPILPGGEDVGTDLLSIDAKSVSNVARFINHSCEPNLMIQQVFARDCRNMLNFYVVLFAVQDTPANEELTYNYGDKMTHASGSSCMCGAPTCAARTAPTAS
ncbi:hypothetical protein FOA52_007886 [Chlamydomonas sp. UWO 241]|nr:hypothetical protein FOA52_007886 [Chlamydomonas sp. UWO 241]